MSILAKTLLFAQMESAEIKSAEDINATFVGT
jgi:hypothetical protein